MSMLCVDDISNLVTADDIHLSDIQIPVKVSTCEFQKFLCTRYLETVIKSTLRTANFFLSLS